MPKYTILDKDTIKKEIMPYLSVAKIWGIERSGFFNGREKWAKGFENQRV